MEKEIIQNTQINCEDIGILLKKMRAIDDKIVYQLNLATPTESFRGEVNPTDKCKSLYIQLNDTYDGRNKLISHCLAESTNHVKSLKADLVAKQNDHSISRLLRREQGKVRELQNEMTIEEIIRQRSFKAFEERCKLFFRPDAK